MTTTRQRVVVDKQKPIRKILIMPRAKKKEEQPDNVVQMNGGAPTADGKPPEAEQPEEGKKSHKRPKQTDMLDGAGAGVERPQIAELEAAADDYVNIRDERILKSTEEKTRKASLIAMMQKHKLKEYKYGDKVIVLKPKDATTNVQVKAVADYEVEVDEGEETE